MPILGVITERIELHWYAGDHVAYRVERRLFSGLDDDPLPRVDPVGTLRSWRCADWAAPDRRRTLLRIAQENPCPS